MSRTLTIKSGGDGRWSPGWHEVVVSDAKYGTYKDSKYIDVWFEGYNDNFNLRMYAKIGKDGEEFAIGQLFRFANAGITEGLEGADGTTIVKLNDDASELVGKSLNVFLYKNGKYSRVLTNVAPTVFKNVVESFEEKDIDYWKGRAEKYFADYVEPKLEETVEKVTDDVTADVPF